MSMEPRLADWTPARMTYRNSQFDGSEQGEG